MGVVWRLMFVFVFLQVRGLPFSFGTSVGGVVGLDSRVTSSSCRLGAPGQAVGPSRYWSRAR